MNSKKDLLLPYCLAGILLVVSVLCYAGAAEPPEEPVRQMFECVAGKVLFTHNIHTSESGYDIACADCHHHPEDAEDSLACGKCHNLPEDGNFPQVCSSQACHGPDGDAGEIEIEVSDMVKKADALHDQCIGCHKENEAGPEECASCHVKYSF
ncbi:MAG TPA: cytochrome C [Desulfobacterales bacterium]|nr:MAG: cytochrome C [Deltaproteobacteria bacterium]HHC25286.1 cytochrome C [Desulfobacterales bacterium]